MSINELTSEERDMLRDVIYGFHITMSKRKRSVLGALVRLCLVEYDGQQYVATTGGKQLLGVVPA